MEDGVFIFVLSLFLFFYFKENYNFPKFQESGAAFSWRGGGGGQHFPGGIKLLTLWKPITRDFSGGWVRTP